MTTSSSESLASEGNLLVSWLLRKNNRRLLTGGNKKNRMNMQWGSQQETMIQSFIIDSPIDSISWSTKTCLKRCRAGSLEQGIDLVNYRFSFSIAQLSVKTPVVRKKIETEARRWYHHTDQIVKSELSASGWWYTSYNPIEVMIYSVYT